ncbi:MAG: hypothetical protein RIR17_1430 [Planctomycetota bacterium]|jgi:arsenate reductase-like glutaredoxin family protein
MDHHIAETVDATKVKLGREDALKLAKKVTRIIAGKGKKITSLDMKKDKPDEETLTGILLGPTGNLRAPTMIVGNTMLVGFNEEAYAILKD